MITIAVLGATGNLGRAVIRRGLERGMAVRAMSRNAESAEFPDGVRVVNASDADTDVLLREFTGVDAVFIVFPASLAHPEEYPDQVNRVFDAARAAGAARVIGLVGSAGARTGHGDEHMVDTDYFGETHRHFYQSIHKAWDVYRGQQSLDWVAFVPAARMQVHLQDRNRYRYRTDEQLVSTDDASRAYFDVSQISYGDCALAMVDEVDMRRFSRQFVTLGW